MFDRGLYILLLFFRSVIYKHPSRVPTLAIHLDRTVNEAFKFNKEEHLLPILGEAF